jgi:hypothetical protein
MKEREHLYLEIPTYHDTVIILASVLFISTQLTYILMYNPIAFTGIPIMFYIRENLTYLQY